MWFVYGHDWRRSRGEGGDLCMVMTGKEVGVRGVICTWSWLEKKWWEGSEWLACMFTYQHACDWISWWWMAVAIPVLVARGGGSVLQSKNVHGHWCRGHQSIKAMFHAVWLGLLCALYYHSPNWVQGPRLWVPATLTECWLLLHLTAKVTGCVTFKDGSPLFVQWSLAHMIHG